MNKSFLKYYIIDAVKPCFPCVEIGKRDFSKEVSYNMISVKDIISKKRVLSQYICDKRKER